MEGLKTRTYRLKSTCPMLMHSGELANPLNSIVREISKISSKRKKTDADFEEMSKLEWFGSLYVSNGKIILPPDYITAMLIKSAGTQRKTKSAQAGLYCQQASKIEFKDSNLPLEELYKKDEYKFIKQVKIQRARITRTRVKFDDWQVETTIVYNPSLINPREIDEWMTIGGIQIGLGDWRPYYGRFEAKVVA